jgi:hypothetical protein
MSKNSLNNSNNISLDNDLIISRENLGYKPKNNSDSNTRTRGYSPGYNKNNTKPAPPPPPPSSGSNVYKPKQGN